MHRFAVGLLALALMPSQGIAQSPELYIEHIDQQLKQRIRLSSKPIRVPGNTRIDLNVVLDAGNLAERIEQLEIKADNQGPDYFKYRPPANIKLAVRRLTPQGKEDVSISVFSSGGGGTLNVEHIQVYLGIIVDATIREAKFREFFESNIACALKESPAPEIAALLNSPATIDNMIRYYQGSTMAYIAPGDYEITAYYTPTTADHWHGHLTSTPARITVYEAEFASFH